MGKKRIFTMEAYQDLEGGIATEPLADFFSDIPLQIREVFDEMDLEEDLSSIKEYLQDISDLNDYTQEKLHTIFSNVEDVDERYGAMFEADRELYQAYGNIIEKLADSIGSGRFVSDFSSASFLAEVQKDSEKLLLAKWETVLAKPEDEISEAEYIQLAGLLVQTQDHKLLEQMLNQCYEYVDVFQYSEGGGITTVQVIYQPGGKFQKLAAAMNNTMRVLLAGYMISGSLEPEEQEELTTAIRYNQLLQELKKQGGKLAVISQKNQVGTGRILNEKLIQIGCSKNGELEIMFYPYQGGAGAYEAQDQTVLTLSGVSTGGGAQQIVRMESRDYLNAYLGTGQTVPEAVGKETISQILAGLTGKLPGAEIISAAGSILNAGEQAADHTIEQSQSMADLENIMGRFRLLYVSVDTNQDAEKHSFSLYPGKDSKKLVDKFNAYMQTGGGKTYAEDIGYSNLPGGKLTLEYLLKYPQQVVEMLEKLAVEWKTDSVIDYEEEIGM